MNLKSIVTLSCLLLSFISFSQTTWYTIDSGTDKNLQSIQFISDQMGYIGGENVLLKTVDGGITWNEVQIESLPFFDPDILHILDLHFFSEDHGVLLSGGNFSGGIIETFDGGTTWTFIQPANPGFCQFGAIHYFDEDSGIAGGAGCFEGHVIDKFENGIWSETTAPQSWNTGDIIATVNFRDELFGLAGTQLGTLLRTTDGGLNWDSISNLASGYPITDFIFLDDKILATHHQNLDYGVMVSLDEGLTWSIDNETATFYYPRMNAAHKNGLDHLFLGGIETNTNYGVLFEKSGEFWDYSIVDRTINDINSHSDNVTFCVGEEGFIIMNVDPQTLSSISENSSLNFIISPNPAETHISLSGHFPSFSEFVIYDIMGKRVKSGSTIGSSNIDIEIENLKAGIYSISIYSDNFFHSELFEKL